MSASTLDFGQLFQVWENGGAVMYPLTICAMGLWFCLGFRYWLLKFDHPSPGQATHPLIEEMTEYLERNSPSQGRARFANISLVNFQGKLGQLKVLTKSFLMVAPLLGLLGTVSGMMETFASLGQNALFAHSGGIAGGISEALLTTQVGLVISVPGVLVSRFLERKERVVAQLMELAKDDFLREQQAHA